MISHNQTCSLCLNMFYRGRPLLRSVEMFNALCAFNHVVENTQQAPVTAEVTGHPRRKTAPVPGPDSNLPFRVGLAHPGRGKASERHTQTDRLLSTICSL